MGQDVETRGLRGLCTGSSDGQSVPVQVFVDTKRFGVDVLEIMRGEGEVLPAASQRKKS